jgi:hypothetical protein
MKYRQPSLTKSRFALFVFWSAVIGFVIYAQSPDFSTLRRFWPIFPVVLAGMIMRALMRRQTKIIETYSVLKDGSKMGVKAVLESSSSWCWQPPDRLRELTVLIEGKKTSIPRRVFRDVYPLDSNKNPQIVEVNGHLEVILWGREGSSLNEIRWSFRNKRFLERRIIRNHQLESNVEPISETEIPEQVQPDDFTSNRTLTQPLLRSEIEMNTDYPSIIRSEDDVEEKIAVAPVCN